MIAYNDNKDAKFSNKYSKSNAKNDYCNLIYAAVGLLLDWN